MYKPKWCGKLRRIYYIAEIPAFLLCLMQTGFAAAADGAPDAGKILRDTQTGERVIALMQAAKSPGTRGGC